MTGNVSSSQKKKRSERAVSLELSPGVWQRLCAALRRSDVVLRLSLCAVAAAALIVATLAWQPAFTFRKGQVLARDVTSRVAFELEDLEKTEQNREDARRNTPYVYRLDPEPLVQLQQKLTNTVAQISAAETLAAFGVESWAPFELDGESQLPDEERQKRFAQFKSVLAGMGQLDLFNKALDDILTPYRRNGLLRKLASLAPDEGGMPADIEGNQRDIGVYNAQFPDEVRIVPVEEVLVSNIVKDGGPLKDALVKNPDIQAVAERVFRWLKAGLSDASTLTLDEPRTRLALQSAGEAVPSVRRKILVGQRIAAAGVPLEETELAVLQAEHQAASDDDVVGQSAAGHVAAMLIFLGAIFALCGFYAWIRQRPLIDSAQRLAVVLILFVAAVAGARWALFGGMRLEIIPLVLLALILSIAYGRETAWVVGVAATVVLAVIAGLSVTEFLVLFGVQTVAVLATDRIRSRARLIRVTGIAAATAVTLVLTMSVLDGPALHWNVLWESCLLGVWTLTCGFLVTGLLPFIERLFGVLTDLSLLELGDATHPLLQELVRRAPGTYNHSINVASLGEAAAEAIGAHGLLVRVGAYFHDIGKMLKPHYFTENQDRDDNRHEALVPAMSTLIIIAHVKDGADLARQHRLPRRVVDFIEQHHGTTLVEFFYQRASERERSDEPSAKVEESSFRYPGPKPQTKEAAVLMLADAVESATRSLTEPTSSRIESLVEEIAVKKLMDGQFDECPITLQEIRMVQDSLVKSLIAVYHGRVKYPSQRTA